MGTLGNASPSPAASSGEIPAFAREIQDDWFDVAPSAKRSRAVARAWRQFWQYNALNALASAAEGLGQELPRLLGAVEAYDVDRPLAPRLSARLATLMEAMSKGDGYGVYDTVQAWCADPPSAWYAEGLATESIAVHPWEAQLLHEVRVTRVEGAAPLHFFPLLETDLAPLHAAAMKALSLIADVDPDMHAEIVSHVTLVKLFTGRGIEGLSSPKAFGAIWLRMPEAGKEIPWFLEHLVHEYARRLHRFPAAFPAHGDDAPVTAMKLDQAALLRRAVGLQAHELQRGRHDVDDVVRIAVKGEHDFRAGGERCAGVEGGRHDQGLA
jgi:hypothetical protein